MRCNVTTGQKAAHEASILYTLRLSKLWPAAEYEASLLRRKLRLPGRQGRTRYNHTEPVAAPTYPLREWIDREVKVVYSRKKEGTLLISTSVYVKDTKHPNRSTMRLPYQQFDAWAEFWANLRPARRCPDYEVKFDGPRGLGIFAAKSLPAEHVVARGVLDPDAVSPDLGLMAQTRGGGTVRFIPTNLLPRRGANERACARCAQAALFGPVSLLNAACARCSTAYFERTDGEYVAKLKEGVRGGDAITVQYAQGFEDLVCACGRVC